jgi:predicted heme/steroid binding protein
MTKNIAICVFISSVLGLTIIGGAVYWQLGSADSSGRGTDGFVSEPTNRSYTLQELAKFDGKNGNKCLVAVDDEVYLIEGFDLWKNGQHAPSGGRARCGLDLTEVIDDAPHGRSKLQLLERVGTLE